MPAAGNQAGAVHSQHPSSTALGADCHQVMAHPIGSPCHSCQGCGEVAAAVTHSECQAQNTCNSNALPAVHGWLAASQHLTRGSLHKHMLLQPHSKGAPGHQKGCSGLQATCTLLVCDAGARLAHVSTAQQPTLCLPAAPLNPCPSTFAAPHRHPASPREQQGAPEKCSECTAAADSSSQCPTDWSCTSQTCHFG